MKEHFKEQLDAGPADGSDDFKVTYILESTDGSKSVRTVDNHSIDDLDELLKFIRHVGAVPILTPRD